MCLLSCSQLHLILEGGAWSLLPVSTKETASIVWDPGTEAALLTEAVPEPVREY